MADELIADRQAEVRAEEKVDEAERLGVPALTADGEWAKAKIKAKVRPIR